MNTVAHSEPKVNDAATSLGDYVGNDTEAGERPTTTASPADRADDAVSFLASFDPDGWHNIVRFDGSRWDGFTMPPGRWDEARRFILQGIDRGDNLYFSINEPAPGSGHAKLSKADIGKIRSIFADIDLPGRNGPQEITELGARLRDDTTACPPTFFVDSGGGFQLHWKLSNPIAVDNEATAWAEAQGKSIGRLLKGDAIQNIDRLARLPGTLNSPSSSKQARGRVMRPATLVRQTNDAFSPDQLAAFAPPLAKAAEEAVDRDDAIARRQTEFSSAWRELTAATDFQDLPAGLQDRLQTAMSRGSSLARLWTGQDAPSDTSGSGYREALARLLAQSGFEAEDYVSLAWVWDLSVQAGHDRDEKLTPRALARDWERCGYPHSPRGIVERHFEEPMEPLFPATSGASREGKPTFDFAAASRLSAGETETIPPRQFVLGTRFQPGVVTIGSGPPGVSKSTFSILTALAIATGRALTQEYVARPGPVLIYNAEDPREEMRRRIMAIARVHEVPDHVVRERVRILSGYDDHRLVFAERKERNGPIAPNPEITTFADFVRSEGIVYVGLDPMIALHRGLDENASADMEALGVSLRSFAQRSGAAIDLIHHTVKTRGSSDQSAGSADASRGSSSIMGFVRAAYTLFPMSSAMAAELALAPERASQMVRLDDAKRNYARRQPGEKWFEMISALPTGERVEPRDFHSTVPEVAARALSSVGVHLRFDANRQRVLAALAKADDGAAQDAELLRFIASAMTQDAISRTDLARVICDSLGVSPTTGREKINAVVPSQRQHAREVEVDRCIYAVWRERQKTAGNPAWYVHRQFVRQIVEAEEVSNGGVFG